MPAHRSLCTLGAAALVLGGVALAVRLGGGVPRDHLPEAAPAVPAPESVQAVAAAEPTPSTQPESTQVESEPPAPAPRGPDPYKSRPPALTEQEALVHWACLGELQRLRPIPGGSDAEQRHAIEVRKGFDAFAGRMAALDTQIKGKEPPPEPVNEIQCPEQQMRQMYEEDRNRDLQWLRDHPSSPQ